MLYNIVNTVGSLRDPVTTDSDFISEEIIGIRYSGIKLLSYVRSLTVS